MKTWILGGLCLALGAAGLGVACSNSGNSGSGGSGVASGACANFVSAYCAKANECSPTGIVEEFGDVATCVNRTSLSCVNIDQLPGTSLTTDKLEGCTAVISTSTCDGLLTGITSDACKAAPGTLPNGSACGESAQCSGGRCNKTTSTDGGFSTETNLCGKCETATPSTCGDAGACTAPQVCEYDTKTGPSCVTPAAEGSACAPGVPCASGLTCRNMVCTKRVGKDAPCTTSSDCDSSLGLYCIAMTCQLPAHVGPGESCASPSPRCSAGSDCVYTYADGGSTSVCVARAADNAPCNDSKGPRCTSPAQCLSGVCTLPDYTQCK